MPLKKEYNHYLCRDCDIDFLVKSGKKGRTFCPDCGENIYVEMIRKVWIDRSFNYQRRYTEEEDEIIMTGRNLGYSTKRIAESLEGRTTKSVSSRINTLRKSGVKL